MSDIFFGPAGLNGCSSLQGIAWPLVLVFGPRASNIQQTDGGTECGVPQGRWLEISLVNQGDLLMKDTLQPGRGSRCLHVPAHQNYKISRFMQNQVGSIHPCNTPSHLCGKGQDSSWEPLPTSVFKDHNYVFPSF